MKTLNLKRKMPKKLDHVQSRSEHAPRLWEKGTDSKAPRRPWKRPAQSMSEFDIHSMSVVCQVKQGHVPEKEVVSRRVGTSANP